MQNADNLDQIKWIFDGKKKPKGTKQGQNFKQAMEEAINKLKLDRDLARKLLKETDNPTVKDLKNHLKENLDNLFLIK